MSNLKLFLTILISVLISFNSFGQKWDLRVDEEQVKIYTRSIEGSNVQEVRGEVTIKSNMGTILSVIDSIPGYVKWMKNCSFAERVKKISKGSGYSYYVIKTPWPVVDRDACVNYKVTQDTATRVVTITLNGVKDFIPAKPDRVRVPSLKGFWQLTPVAKGVTKVVYQVHCETGGYVPAAIVNAFITGTPHSNLVNLKKIVESPYYPKVVMDLVKEL